MKPDFNKMELIPTIVQDYKTKDVLMMAYVNEEAYTKMLETKETYFYSRSRQSLWHKGEISGHYQYVKGMYLDCDLDTLLIFVEQKGAACHTGSYSCFFNELLAYNSTNIFQSLESLIKERKEQPVEKSYTNYLLDEGVDKICKKIGEEASETIIAAKNNDKEELIGEISDVFYHIFVLMAKQGV
ncbi:MAG: bifunctional phosphoribosyl-AMP cyclohydrolase/phosphoribosyl-ATP diphosphatase HisIE, partial [Coprobacillaceae bacterium]